MIYKIVCAGVNTFKDVYKYDDEEVIIAVDGGFEIANKLNLKIDYFVGDFDSLSKNEEKSIINIKHEFHKSEKDETDFELALRYVLKQVTEADEIIVYNATGGRLDHYEGAIRLLKKYSKENIKIIDDRNEIFILDFEKNKSFTFEKDSYKYVSFFNIYDDTTISLKGFKYELSNYLMKSNDYLCISNEVLEIGIIYSNKDILVIKSK